MKSKQSSKPTLRQGPVLIAAAVLLLVGAIVLPPLMRKESVKPVEETVVPASTDVPKTSETVSIKFKFEPSVQ